MLEQAVKQHKWEAIPLLQGMEKVGYEDVIVHNLDIVARVNAFLRLFKAEMADEGSLGFQRGFCIGIVCSIMADSNPDVLSDVMADVEMMIAMLSAKNYNIMTGGELENTRN